MNAGDFRHRIAFERRATTADKYGGTRGDFIEQFVVAAKLKPKFGTEAVQAARLAGTQPVTITVRQSTKTRQITDAWRARHTKTGKIYNIRSLVDPEDKRAYLEILCEEGAAT